MWNNMQFAKIAHEGKKIVHNFGRIDGQYEIQNM